tara:strand:+ start:1135 stop:2337 length:1203 start_codon:yes stop_codon:yes gene_type:complete
MSKIIVTGIGAISAIGNNVAQIHKNLQSSKTGIGKAQFFKSKYVSDLPFGEINLTNDAIRLEFESIENPASLTRTDLLAFKAFQEAIEDAQLSKKDISSIETAFISSSTVGGMSETEHFYEDSNLKNVKASNFVSSYNSNTHLLKIIKHYNIKGTTTCINTACSSSANAIMLGAKLIKAGIVKRAIVGGVDSLSKYTVNGFNALQILSNKPCMPFDNERTGLTLGEGAGYLVLEAADNCLTKTNYAVIAGYGNSNDAFHASSISSDAKGIVHSIKNALSSAGISSKEVDYINTHGTATLNNDSAETFGISELFEGFPPFNSTKSYTGHTLAAAGALEAIFSILSLNNNELYKSLNVNTPIEPYNKFPIKEYQQVANLKTVLSNSFGFAGNCTSLIIQKCI